MEQDLNAAETNSPQSLEIGRMSSAVTTAVVTVDQLILDGVREVVVCPGSRSAALALACAEAERAGRLRMHVRTDERTGAFLALGLAKATRRAVPIITTSGTAVANCLPAMVEATLSHVPLLVISANRPLRMIGTGANQTIEQVGIFGAHAVAVLSTGDPDAVEAAGAATADPEEAENALTNRVREAAAAAVQAATDPVTGGGVQLDVPLKEPLVPESADALSLFAQQVAGQEAAGQEAAVPEATVSDANVQSSARPLPHGKTTVDISKRTLVIAGSITDEVWAREVMEQFAHVPTIAEPTAPAPGFPVHCAAAAMFSASEVSQGEYSAMTQPEQVVVIGRPTLHRPVLGLLKSTDAQVIVLSETDSVFTLASNITAVASGISVTGEHPTGWTKVCQAISDMGADAVRDVLGASVEEHFTGMHAAAVVADSLRDGDAFVVGASSAIRDVSRAGLPFDGVRTLASRGAAGIDGTLSTAIGVAMAHASADPTAVRAPRTVALVGDLTFLHDAGALNIGQMERRPENLLIVVVNDAGGAIFEGLEPGQENLRTFGDGTSAFERVFATPVSVDIRSVCDAYDTDYQQTSTAMELLEAIQSHAEQPPVGITVVEARVDRGWRREMEEKINHVVAPS